MGAPPVRDAGHELCRLGRFQDGHGDGKPMRRSRRRNRSRSIWRMGCSVRGRWLSRPHGRRGIRLSGNRSRRRPRRQCAGEPWSRRTGAHGSTGNRRRRLQAGFGKVLTGGGNPLLDDTLRAREAAAGLPAATSAGAGKILRALDRRVTVSRSFREMPPRLRTGWRGGFFRTTLVYALAHPVVGL